MNSSDALTGFVDQLNAPASAFSTLTAASSAFPTLADFNASSTSEALCQRVLLIHNMGNRLFCLSRKLMDPAVVLGHVIC